MIGELSKVLSSEVGKTEMANKYCSKIETTSPAEKEETSVNKSPSREINAEDDLKTTILNLSKQIQELKQECLSTSFQHHRLYSNPDPLGSENGLPKSYHSHSQSTKHLRSQAYTKKIKYCSNICSSSYDSQMPSNESSSDEEYNHFHDKRVHFLATNSRKGKYSSISQETQKINIPVKGPTSPVGENISSVRELSLSLVREGQSPVSVTSKTGMKQQGENNHSEKRKQIRPSEDVFNQYASQTDGYDSEFEREPQSVQSLNLTQSMWKK